VQVGSDAALAGIVWRPKAARLVKMLALARGHQLHRDQVVELLWPEFELAAAANNLHRTLHAARHVLEPRLAAGAPSAYLQLRGDVLALSPPTGRLWIDVEAFEVAAGVARHARDPVAYRAALALHTGELLPEDRYEDWAAGRREELRGLRLALLGELARLHEERGECSAAVEALEHVVASEPTEEAAHAALMRLHARAGRRSEALQQYERLREALRRELDTEPESGVQQLHADLLAGRVARPLA